MKYVFNQYQGLGDILFCEPIAKHYYNNGENEKNENDDNENEKNNNENEKYDGIDGIICSLQ